VGSDSFPLFEVSPLVSLRYFYDASSVDEFRKTRPVVAVHRWLKAKGIDLIFVPVPKMTEVYVEKFLESCPPDGVVAPHVRQALFELLESDVEVIDLLPTYRRLREPCPDYLYNTADSHWAPRGMRIAAKEVADRVLRYAFGERARFALPIANTTFFAYEPFPFKADGDPPVEAQDGWLALTPAEKALAAPVQTTTIALPVGPDGERLADDPKSPVVVIGDSYVEFFRHQLMRELNLRVDTKASADATTEAFADFLREPERLSHCRTLVWIVSERNLVRFKPLPKPIQDMLNN
jgi:hypothetical protein